MHIQCFIAICMNKIYGPIIHSSKTIVFDGLQKQHVYAQCVTRNRIPCIIKRWSTSASTYCSTYINIGRPQFVVYPPCITCVSKYCCTYSYIFIGRPQLVVYPPRNICYHVLLYICYWVDHNLWSTLHACIALPWFWYVCS